MRATRSTPEILGRRGDAWVERDPRRPSGRLLRQGDMDSSYVDLADPSHLEFDYLRWIRLVLDLVRARRVVHIGGGACALPRALALADPSGRQDVCELDSDVLALAREHCGLRRAPGLRVRQGDGRAHLARLPDASADAVVIDAFVGAAVPRRLVTVEALADAARVAPLTLINVVDNRARMQVRAIAAALACSYTQVWTLGGRVGNTVVVGGAVALDLDRIGARAAADSSPARITASDDLAGSLAGVVAPRDGDVIP